MNRSANVLLAAAISAATVAGSAALTLRRQSARLRAQVDADRTAPTPESRGVVDALGQDRATVPGDRSLPALAVLGDTWLCGDTVARPGQLIARGLSTILGSPVRMMDQATASARADDIARQVNRLLAHRDMVRDLRAATPTGEGQPPRYAVVSMGMTDIIHPVSGTLTLPVLTTALNRLQREGGYRVIVLTCPDLGSLPLIRRPLASVLRRSSRVLSGSQWLAAVSAGALPVSIHQTLSGTTRVGLIATDGHRPSRLGYQQIAAAAISRIAHDRALTVTAREEQDPS